MASKFRHKFGKWRVPKSRIITGWGDELEDLCAPDSGGIVRTPPQIDPEGRRGQHRPKVDRRIRS